MNEIADENNHNSINNRLNANSTKFNGTINRANPLGSRSYIVQGSNSANKAMLLGSQSQVI